MLRALRRMLRLPDPVASVRAADATSAMLEAIRRVRDRHPGDRTIEREYRRLEETIRRTGQQP